MAPQASFQIEGLKELAADFKALPGKLRRRSLFRAARKGGNLIQERAKRRAPVRTGRLRESITTTVRQVGTSAVEADVGPKVAFKYEKVQLTFGIGKYIVATGWYAHFVEFGHVMKARGKVIGSIPPKPFLRPAADESVDDTVAIAVQELNRDIEKFNRKRL